MAVISGSAETILAGANGTWFTVNANNFIADVDNAATVRLETRRGASDTAPKVVATERSGADVMPKIVGPCSVAVSAVSGRQYRFVVLSAPAGGAIVAADA